MQKKKSIFLKLILYFICLGLLPLLLAGGLLYGRFKKNMERVILDDMTRMASYAARNTREMVEECSDLTKRIYDIYAENNQQLYQILKDPVLPQDQKTMEIILFLNEVMDGDSRIRTAYFAAEDGRLYYTTRNIQKVLNESGFREWIGQEEAEKESFAVLPTHRDTYFPNSDNWVLTFRRSYQDLSSFKTIGDCLGELYLDVDLSRLSTVLQDIDMGVEEAFCIVDEQGICIYSSDEKMLGTRREDLAGLLEQRPEYSGQLLENGRYTVYERLDNCGWSVAAQAEQTAVLQNLESTRRAIMIMLGGAFLVLLYLYSYFLKRIQEPFEALEKGMQEIQQGNLQNRIDVGDREDEIGVLAEGLNNMARELENYIKRVYVAEIRQRDAELDALKSQIKPHYLYNTLEVIRMTALGNEDPEAAQMVESLSRQLKYLIGGSSDRVSLRREIENIREYFYIMRIRYENRIHLEISVDEDVMDAQIIKLSLQPIVENAVKHGLRPKKGTGTVRIEAHRAEKEMELMVMDDGVGMKAEAVAELNARMGRDEMGIRTSSGWEHVGLKNVCDRIHKNFGPRYGLEIFSEEESGTIVVCRLPLLWE